MKERDVRYTSWIISIVSIIYGIAYSFVINSRHEEMLNDLGNYYYVYYALFFCLVIFGILKMLGLVTLNKKIKRISIVSLMFIWGFIWTANIVETVGGTFDDKSITLFPIVAICAYIAFRGDYN